MPFIATFLLAMVVLFGCHHMPQTSSVIRITSPAEYPDLVGKRVELAGEVTRSRIPQILGVDLPQLEEHRGRQVIVTGVLRRTVVTQAQIDAEIQRLGGQFAHRGAGTFYHLDELRYEIQP
jgi:hypothetical protein